MEYLPLLVAWMVALVSPGPDFLAVLRVSVARSRRAGMLVAAGVVTGQACWALAALAGLTALVARYEQLYLVLRLAGAAFLIVYGLTTLRSAWRRAPEQPGAGAEAPRSGWRSWRLGLLTNLANPKALVFYGALFASLLPPDVDTAGQAEVVTIMLGTGLAWFVLVAAMASVPAAVAGYRKARRAVDAVTGGLFVALGAALARPAA
ncbi:LysE family translocator [Pseudonocardia eucalypti]|uniref:LysE family translocator n=1 Tax=Pseudonocardia eucalypti TaxID=648755 RepID=A0ABP9PLB2_9PSEU|nr:threonine/homoserine/homoserine lactone efflux protein [Pseudonocardia eucalypti]